MGYTAEFDGSVSISPPRNVHEIAYLRKFASRRMDRARGPCFVDGPGRFEETSVSAAERLGTGGRAAAADARQRRGGRHPEHATGPAPRQQTPRCWPLPGALGENSDKITEHGLPTGRDGADRRPLPATLDRAQQDPDSEAED